jgi:hypothetical protein
MDVRLVLSKLNAAGIQDPWAERLLLDGDSGERAAQEHLNHGDAFLQLIAARERVLTTVRDLGDDVPTSAEAALDGTAEQQKAFRILTKACEAWKLLTAAHEAFVASDLKKPIDRLFLQTQTFPDRRLGLTATVPAGGGGTLEGLLALARSGNAWTPSAYQCSQRRGEWERSFSEQAMVVDP